MRRHDLARQTDRHSAIRTPDQLQQAKRPDALGRPAPDAPREARPGGSASQSDGVLGQLATERAHD